MRGMNVTKQGRNPIERGLRGSRLCIGFDRYFGRGTNEPSESFILTCRQVPNRIGTGTLHYHYYPAPLTIDT